MSSASQKRIQDVQQLIIRENTGGYMARDTIDIAYMTGFDGVFDSEWAHALLITPSQVVLHTDSRYYEAIQKAAQAAKSEIIIDGTPCSHGEFVAKRGAFGQLSIDHGITVKEYRELEKTVPSTMFIVTKDVVRRMRARKDADEIARLQQAQAVADKAFGAIVGFISDNMHAGTALTERQVARELDNLMFEFGADALSFETIMASGENGANPHARPTNRELAWGDCVVIDFGCVVNGYCSDMTRTVFLGEPTPFMRKAYDAITAANEAVEAALRPGVTGKEMQELAESILAERGFAGAMGHGLGHGVGREVHEMPSLNRANDKPLEEGNVVTVEPGIYLVEGHELLEAGHAPFGMRLEDFGVLTAEGFSKFTQKAHTPVIIA